MSFDLELYNLKEQAGLVYVGNGEWLGNDKERKEFKRLEKEYYEQKDNQPKF